MTENSIRPKSISSPSSSIRSTCTLSIIFGEETITEQLYKILPIGAPIPIMALSLLFCAIQAMVYTMLTASYLQEFIDE